MLFPGTPIQLVCVSDGIPQPIISWYRDGTFLVNGTDGVSIVASWNDSLLTVTDSMGEQGGEYNCTGSNIAGSISIEFIVLCKYIIRTASKLHVNH